MRHTPLRRIFVCALLLLLAAPIFAAKTAVKNLYRYTLPNGLSLFVMENDAAPLAYIEIAVRAGGVTQTPQTAGLFHLYEHMMFKGNAKYADQAAVQDALNDMGVSTWNGSTGTDKVNYYFTVPSALIREGLEFWSYAIRTPRMDQQELENEKSVVLSEIGADTSDPGHIFPAFLAKTLYAESPWQLDPSGIPAVVENATVAQLREIQAQYYVPDNAALFIGGDVHHKQVYKLVKEIYGDWKPGTASLGVKPPSKAPLGKGQAATRRFVYADPRSSGSYIQAGLYLRGPDGETDISDTYAADVWSGLLNAPTGYYARSLVEDPDLAIPDPDYVGGSYLTRRTAGIISLSAAMLNKGEPVGQAEHLLSRLQELCREGFTSPDFLTDSAIADTKRQQTDNSIYAQETAAGVLSSLSFFWAACGADYFFDYDKRFERINAADVIAFVEAYLQDAGGMYVVFVSPDVYKANKAAFDKNGYTEITAGNAFWWQE